MSRETLLDEAITKAKEAGDWQLVEWLRMARGGESAARWYNDKLRDAHRIERKLMAENAKLRELLQDLAICACGKYCYGCPHQYDGCDRDQRMRELGVEVDG